VITPKQERFAIAIASGDYPSASAVYREIYQANGSRMETVNSEASRLFNHPQIAARIEELRNATAAKARRTLKGHLDRLETLEGIALNENDVKAAIRAQELSARAMGLYRGTGEDLEAPETPEALAEEAFDLIMSDPLFEAVARRAVKALDGRNVRGD